MATRRRNEWLEDPASEFEDTESEREDSDTRAYISNNAKRRKIDEGSASDHETESEDDFLGEAASRPAIGAVKPALRQGDIEEEEDSVGSANQPEDEDDDEDDVAGAALLGSKYKTSLAKKLAKSANKTKKSGVVYISRVPPFMKPFALKHLLEPHAPSGLNRIFLTPESNQTRQSRLRSGGNKKKSYTDGWIEFLSKKEAKIAVELLNARTIGGKGYYRDDVWNLKYLRGFKWSHLTEQIANENAERSSRVRAEDARERKEVREFLRNVEQGKMLEGMERKAVAKAMRKDDADGDGGVPIKSVSEPKRTFTQVKVQSAKAKSAVEPSVDAKRVLSKIF